MSNRIPNSFIVHLHMDKEKLLRNLRKHINRRLFSEYIYIFKDSTFAFSLNATAASSKADTTLSEPYLGVKSHNREEIYSHFKAKMFDFIICTTRAFDIRSNLFRWILKNLSYGFYSENTHRRMLHFRYKLSYCQSCELTIQRN